MRDARPERVLEAVRAEERRRPPEPVDLAHLVRDRDLRRLADLLEDELHREERREVVRAHRLARPGCRTGCGRFGMSAATLYQRSGSADSGSSTFVSVIAGEDSRLDAARKARLFCCVRNPHGRTFMR